MVGPSRRTFLKTGLIASAVSISGCSSVMNLVGGGPDIEDLQFSVAIDSQPTNSSPGKVRLSLTNTANSAINLLPGVHGGLPLEFIEPMEGKNGRAILFPEETQNVQIYLGELPTSANGCWQVEEDEPGEAYLGRVSAAFSTKVKPNETYAVNHDVYYQGPESACFPEDRYETITSVQIGRSDNAPEKEVKYVLSVAADGSFSVSVE